MEQTVISNTCGKDVEWQSRNALECCQRTIGGLHVRFGDPGAPCTTQRMPSDVILRGVT